MKMLKDFGLAFRLLKRNWKAIVAFETLYKLATAFIATPLLYGLLRASMRLAGLTYISNDTLKAYLLNPISIVFLFVIVLLIAFVSLVDIEAVICCYHASYYNERIRVSQMFYAAFTKARRVFRRQNWLAAVFVLLIIPLTNVAAVSGYISSLEVPEFIRDAIEANTALHLLYRLVGAGLTLLAFVWALSLHAFTLEDVRFPAAGKESAALLRGRYGRTLFGMLLWEFVLLLIGVLLQAAAAGIAFAGIRILCDAHMRYMAATTALLLIVSAGSVLSAFLSVPLAFAHLSAKYYAYKKEAGQPIEPPETYKALRLRKRTGRVLTAILCLVVIGNAAILITQSYAAQWEMRNLLNRPEIAAHRGSSTRAPENSIPAFENAMQEGADWIELDVHQTKDGVVVVSHDESIKRIAGVDKMIWALTYEELLQYDVGSWFSPEYSGLRIATLDEVLKLCKGRIKLNIELKPTGHEQDFEQNVIELLRQNGYRKGEYILASLQAGALKNCKRIDADLETLFIMAIAAGNVTDIDFADAFSIEESSIDSALVDDIHAAGKRIYAWTVNREANVEKMMGLRVDCILTDNPVMVRRVMNDDSLQAGTRMIVAAFFTPDTPTVRPEIANRP